MVTRAKAMPDGHGQPEGLIRPAACGPDLSEYQILRAAVAQSPVALTVVDQAGLGVLWNPAAGRLFGWKAREVAGRRLPTVDPAFEGELEEIVSRTFGGDPILERETQRRHRDGRLIDVAISTVPLRDRCGRVVAPWASFGTSPSASGWRPSSSTRPATTSSRVSSTGGA